MSFNKKLENYAQLIVNRCVSIQKGEPVLIEALIEHVELVRKIVKYAYKAGASDVIILWVDVEISRQKCKNAPMETLSSFPKWEKSIYDKIVQEKGVSISISAPSMDIVKGVNIDRLTKWAETQREGCREFTHAEMSMQIKWVIVAAPTKEWALKVFPDLTLNDAIEKLWNYIFMCCRLNSDNPLKEFDKHINALLSKAAELNDKKYKKLYYRAPGTDLEVKLPEGHIWHPSCKKLTDGSTLMINFPTEEIATLPHKYGVNGRLQSTMPFIYNGSIIEGMWLEFKDGKVINFGSEKGKEILEKLLHVDEGSCYLGEVALVSQNSPIAKLQTLFYSSLIDENASCHFAVGAAYPPTIKNSEGKSPQELDEMGVNISDVHVDFMVGSDSLDIIGVLPGGIEEYIFKKGIFVTN